LQTSTGSERTTVCPEDDGVSDAQWLQHAKSDGSYDAVKRLSYDR
jgi:hypothetical protein